MPVNFRPILAGPTQQACQMLAGIGLSMACMLGGCKADLSHASRIHNSDSSLLGSSSSCLHVSCGEQRNTSASMALKVAFTPVMPLPFIGSSLYATRKLRPVQSSAAAKHLCRLHFLELHVATAGERL